MKPHPMVKRRTGTCRNCMAWDRARMACLLGYPARVKAGLWMPARPCPRPRTQKALREAPRREELEAKG